MSDLDFLLESETAPADRPGLAWFAQAAGVFGASVCAAGTLFALALTGGWATFDGGAARAAASDLQNGQYYQEQWLNHETGRPFTEQIDAISSDFAALPARDEGYEDIGWSEPLEGEAPAMSPHYGPVALTDDTPLVLEPQEKPSEPDELLVPIHRKA